MVVGTQRRNGRMYPFYRCGHVREDCGARVAISAEMVERVVVGALHEALANVEGRASVEESSRQAAEALETAEFELGSALRVFADFADEVGARERLSELRQARDDARERLGRLSERESAITISAVADWDRLTHDERRALIRAVVGRVTINPGRGPDRIAVELFSE